MKLTKHERLCLILLVIYGVAALVYFLTGL